MEHFTPRVSIIEYYNNLLGNDRFSPDTDGGTRRFPEDTPERVLSNALFMDPWGLAASMIYQTARSYLT